VDLSAKGNPKGLAQVVKGFGGISIKSKVQIPLNANNFLGPGPLAKSKSYPIHVEGTLFMDPDFAQQGWVHEVALLGGGGGGWS
jgi:hypothetical protein